MGNKKLPLIKFPKGSDAKITKDFTAQEFDCPCHICLMTEISIELVKGLQRIRDSLQKPLIITSGYRCKDHQAELEKQGKETVKNSQHLLGLAADFVCPPHPGDHLEAVARGCGFKAVGVGKSFIHVDMRCDKDRRWEYLKS